MLWTEALVGVFQCPSFMTRSALSPVSRTLVNAACGLERSSGLSTFCESVSLPVDANAVESIRITPVVTSLKGLLFTVLFVPLYLGYGFAALAAYAAQKNNKLFFPKSCSSNDSLAFL